VDSHGPLAVGGAVGWEDVWLRVCSGKRTLRLAPCLISREDLRSTLALYRSIADDPSEPTRDFHRSESLVFEALLGEVDANGFAVDSQPTTVRRGRHPGRNFSLANVYTKQAWINQASAEAMLDHYLARLGLRGCRYKWKRPNIVVVPITIPVPDAEPVERGAA